MFLWVFLFPSRSSSAQTCYRSRHISRITLSTKRNTFRITYSRNSNSRSELVSSELCSNRVNLECKHSDMTSPDMWHFLEIREHSQRTGARSVSKFPRWVVNSRPWENREGNQCLATSRRSYNGLWSNLGLGSQRIFYISTLHDLSPSTNLPS